ncbi:O-antigen ligase family protein [Geomonas nitrogeniifigens]|uniref:O-antigen ligase family protein n=1 Tax=Geomonas diazotrophica TaxID=2843197 RepID=A0ABX8JF74_9BACT|nr:O-antigen ligase family protein [Geomonas nitrogeniifigens]QWV95842.1 O-antigen ligase family protein [Geomonas nitrogeniifigens]
MNNLSFIIYELFLVSWFLHLTARIPALAACRFDLVLVAILFTMKIIKIDVNKHKIVIDCKNKLNNLIIAILLITPFSQWPGSVIYRGIPNFVKAVVFFYFTIWFVDTKKKFYIFLTTFVACQSFRFLEPLYLHVTQGYWGSKASMGNWEYMDRLSGAPFDVINPNGLAFVIITIVPFLICNYKLNLYTRIFAIALVPPALYTLMLTGSRSGVVSLFFMTLYIIYKSNRKWIWIVGVVGVLYILAALINESQKDRYRSVFDPTAKNSVTAEGRIQGITKDFKVGLRRPFFGHGLGTSLEANANYGSYAKPSHNLYTEIFQELGIVGLVMFLLFLKSVFKVLLKPLSTANDEEAKDLALIKDALSALAVTTLLFSFASYGLSSYEWYFIAGCVGTIMILTGKAGVNPRANQLII